MINFTVTRTGLEDQLLAEVVKADRPDLEEQKAALTRQQNEYKILLKVRLDAIYYKRYKRMTLVSKFRVLRTISCNDSALLATISSGD